MSLSIPDLLVLTWKSLRSNLLRSGLTTLGVFMGVTAVSATLNIASITNAQIEQKLAERDKPAMIPYLISQDGFFVSTTINENDIRAIQQQIPGIRSISAISEVSINSVQFEGNELTNIRTRGVSKEYITTTGRKILLGRFFDIIDFTDYRPAAVIDRQLATNLFKDRSPLNQTIYAAGMRLIVIGVTETKVNSPDFKPAGELWVTTANAKLLSGVFDFGSIQISPHKLENMPQLKQMVEKLLSQRHPKVQIYISDNSEDILKEKELQATAAKALMGVGLIALFIGGVGIANISIASVIERTKEIGLRRAIGATQTDVMLQFILEAVLLSLLGGTSAIAIVHGLTTTITSTIITAPYQFDTSRAGIALGSALLVGVGASFLPALKASKLDPVVALRSP